MSLLKVSVLSVSGLTLWLAPPFIFSRKIPLHNFMQGIALVSGFACCFEVRRCALKLVKAEEFEAMKDAVIVADTVDELATSAYILEQQRRIEAEQILNPGERTDEQEAELDSIKQSLELLIQKTSSDSGELTVKNLTTRQQEQIEFCNATRRASTGKIKSLRKFGEYRQAVVKLTGLLKQSMNSCSHSLKVRTSNVGREGASLRPASRPRLSQKQNVFQNAEGCNLG
jgi:hypothetical protein